MLAKEKLDSHMKLVREKFDSHTLLAKTAMQRRQSRICKKIDAAKSYWKRMWLAEFGMSLILRIGPATGILSYLTQIEQVQLSLLNRHFYHVVQPSVVWSVCRESRY